MRIEQSEREMRQELMHVLVECAQTDERIVFLDSDLAASSASMIFQKAHPTRFFNCGIQEANMVALAAGLSAGGFLPFAHSFAAFMSRRTADQIFMSCAYAKQNVFLIGSDPGVAGSPNGGTHMALEDIAIIGSFPGVTILDPSDPGMLRQLVVESVNRPGVYYLRLQRKTKQKLYPSDTRYRIGKAYRALAAGTDATIISAGCIGMVQALTAAETLAAEGIRVRVVDMHTLSPLDEDEVLTAARETGAIVTLDNHSVHGGLGTRVAEVLAGREKVEFARLGATGFGEVGTLDYILEKFGMSAAAVAAAVRVLLGR